MSVTARLATVLLELAVDVSWSALDGATDPEDSAAEQRTLELVEDVLARLRQEPPVVPGLPGKP